jgi:hypothetical protein
VVPALAPVVLADARVDEPLEGLVTCAVDAVDVLGLAAADVGPEPAGWPTFTVTGAFTCGLVAFTGEGATWAVTAGAMSALIRKRIRVNDVVERTIVSRGMRDLLRCPPPEVAGTTPTPITPQLQCACPWHKIRYVQCVGASLRRDVHYAAETRGIES